MKVELPRALTREEALLLDDLGNESPWAAAERCGIPLNHALIALRSLKEMGILSDHYREWVR